MRYILGGKFRDNADRWAWLRHFFWFIDTVLIGGLLIVLGLFPVETASRIGRRVGRWLGPNLKKNDAFTVNLVRAFPEKSPEDVQELIRETWGHAGAVFAEYAHLRTICDTEVEDRLELVSLGEYEDLTNLRQPSVFVTAHYSNWEVAAPAVTRRGHPVAAVYSQLTNPWLERILAKWREPLGAHLIARDESMRHLIQALKDGNSVGLVVDQRVDTGKPVPFFGIDKYTTLIPARLALRHNCPLVPVGVERTGPVRFRVTIYPSIKPNPARHGEIDQATAMMTEAHALFEGWIRKNPGEWFPSKRRWPKIGEH